MNIFIVMQLNTHIVHGIEIRLLKIVSIDEVCGTRIYVKNLLWHCYVKSYLFKVIVIHQLFLCVCVCVCPVRFVMWHFLCFLYHPLPFFIPLTSLLSSFREHSMTLLCKIVLFKVIVIHQLFLVCPVRFVMCHFSVSYTSTVLLHSSSFLPPFLFFSISQNISFIFSIPFLSLSVLLILLSFPSLFLHRLSIFFFFFFFCSALMPYPFAMNPFIVTHNLVTHALVRFWNSQFIHNIINRKVISGFPETNAF